MLDRVGRIPRRALSTALMCCGLAVSLSVVQADELRRGIGDLPSSVDPHKVRSLETIQVFSDLYTGLTTYGPNGQPVLGVAADYSITDDGLSASFHLRADATWSDGTPVTAGDFVFAFRRLVHPDYPSAYKSNADFLLNARDIRMGNAEVATLGVQAVDERTLDLQLEHPAPYIMDLLAQAAFAPLPRHLAEDGTLDLEGAEPVSNGPFLLASRSEEAWTLEKNPNFFDAEAVELERVVYTISPGPGALLEAMESGGLHMNRRYPRDLAALIDQRLPGFRHVHEGTAVRYIVFNTTRAPFDDRRVRRALALCLDRDLFTRDSLGEVATATRSLVAPIVRGYTAPDLPAEPEDRQARRAAVVDLMEAAGHPEGEGLSFEFRTIASPGQAQRASNNANRLIHAGWRQSLQAARITPVETSGETHYGAVLSGDFDVAMAGWLPDYNDPIAYLQLYQRPDNRFNFGGFSDERFAALVRQAETERDEMRRSALLAEAESRLLDSYTILPLWREAYFHLVNPRVQGWEASTIDIHPSRWLSLAEPDDDEAATMDAVADREMP